MANGYLHVSGVNTTITLDTVNNHALYEVIGTSASQIEKVGKAFLIDFSTIKIYRSGMFVDVNHNIHKYIEYPDAVNDDLTCKIALCDSSSDGSEKIYINFVFAIEATTDHLTFYFTIE